MSDVLVRPDAAGQGDDPRRRDDGEPEATGQGQGQGEGTATGTAKPDADGHHRDSKPGRVLLAALLVGAGAIHVAMAPSHLGESAVEGGGFLVAAWAQLGLAVAVIVRPSRRVLAAVAGTSVVLVAAWIWSRTAGLPFGAHSGHAESISVVDGVCVALEVLAAVVAGALLTAAGVVVATRAKAVALVAAVAALGLATGVIASPAARDHASASHGTHGEAGGHAHGAEDDLGFAELSNGHQHEHTTDEPLTDEERVTLARQLASTADLVERYPTLGDAEADGWIRAGPFSPGLGVHYISPGTSRGEGVFGSEAGTMDPDNMPTPTLVFDGLGPDAPLAGFMYQAYGVEGAPEGFAGPNDHWHYHESVCLKREADGSISSPFGADLPGVTEDMCTDIGGSWIDVTGYMVHVWNVPGYESPDGMFTELNRKITCPDGTYHHIDAEDIGSRDTVCRDS